MKAILFWTAYTTEGTLSFSSSLGLQKMCSCMVAFSLTRLPVSLGEETWKTTDEWTKKKYKWHWCYFFKMFKPLLFECSAWHGLLAMNKHDMFVLSEGFIHETRLTSHLGMLIVCHEGVSLFVWLQWHGNIWGRQPAVRFRLSVWRGLEMAHIFFSESSLITL